MRLNFKFFAFFTAEWFWDGKGHVAVQAKNQNQELITKAQKLIKDYHSGSKSGNHVVNVVYIHGKDKEPLQNWIEHLTRRLTAVSNFYTDESGAMAGYPLNFKRNVFQERFTKGRACCCG